MKRLGVVICDRTEATALLVKKENGKKRGIGAMGMNVHTGKFMIFQAKTTVLAMSRPARIWLLILTRWDFVNFVRPRVSEVVMPWAIVQVWSLP